MNKLRRYIPLYLCVALMALAVASRPTLRADSGSWKAIGPGSHLALQVVLSPNYTRDQTLFTAFPDNIYRSTDGGNHWEPAAQLPLPNVSVLTISPDYRQDHTLFALQSWGSDGLLYRSTDDGKTWKPLWRQPHLRHLAISPNYGQDCILFAAAAEPTPALIWVSYDNGDHWQAIADANALTPLNRISQLAISPAFNIDHTLAVTGAGDIYLSHDGGYTWQWNGGHGPHTTVAFAPDAPTSSTLFAAYLENVPSSLYPRSGVIRSTDNGASWQLASGLLPRDWTNPYPEQIRFSLDYKTDHTLFVIFNGAIMGLRPTCASTQTGTPQRMKTPPIPQPWGEQHTPRIGGRGAIFSGAIAGEKKPGIYRSANNGSTWQHLPAISNGSVEIHDVAAARLPGGGQLIFAATGSGLYRLQVPAPPHCTNLIQNGGFEARLNDWASSNSNIPARITNDPVYHGQNAARLGLLPGELNCEGYSSAWQTVTLPANATTISLQLLLYPVTTENSTMAGENRFTRPEPFPNTTETISDTQYVLIRDAANNQWLEASYWSLENSPAWHEREYNLTQYAGKRVKLYVGAYNDGIGGKTAFYVDDIAIIACQVATPADSFSYLPLLWNGNWSAPTPTPQPWPTPTPWPTPITNSTMSP